MVDTPVDRPLLSIVITGRNDNYLGDFKYRITTCINFLCSGLEKISSLEKIELLVVDWNSEIGLNRVIDLSLAAKRVTRFIIVPPETAKANSPHGINFRAEMACNVGVRRAKGQYIMSMPADIIFPAFSLEYLLRLLKREMTPVFDIEKSMMNISRKLIPWQIVQKKYTLEEWERFIQLTTRHLNFHNHFIGLCAGYGATLMHKNLWFESQCLREDRTGWGADDIEIGLRLNRKYPSIDLTGLGIFLYDMYQDLSLRKKSIQNVKLPHISESIGTNNPNWGLCEVDLSIVDSDFDPHIEKKDPQSQEQLPGVDQVLINKELRSLFIPDISRLCLVQSKNDWAVLFLMLYIVKNCWPVKVLEYGMINAQWLFPFVINFFPGVEIYTIGKKSKNEKELKFKPTTYHTLINKKGFDGYAHFMYRDLDSAFDRLKDAFLGPVSFDFVLFRMDLFNRTQILAHFRKVADCLSDGAFLIVVSDKALVFERYWKEICSEFETYGHLIEWHSYSIGLLIKKNATGSEKKNYDRNKVLLKMFRFPSTQISILSMASKVCRWFKNEKYS